MYIESSPSGFVKDNEGKSIKELAQARGMSPGEFALDLALADDFKTELRWKGETPQWTEAVVFGYLILIMILRPRGLLGEETREAG